MQSVIHLEQLRKSYYLGKQELPVLKGIDLDIQKNEFVYRLFLPLSIHQNRLGQIPENPFDSNKSFEWWLYFALVI